MPELTFPSIARPALYDSFDAAIRTGGRVLLLCAAAGTGKTVAVRDWIRRRPGLRTEWLDITGPFDPAGLWSAAADAGGRGPGQPLLLVLDDAHRLTDPHTLAGLEDFLRHLPATVTVVLCARYDPPLRWHTLELSGRVTRFGARELALTEAEAGALCAQHDCRPDDPALAEVMRLTDGWAALVRITARYLATRPDDHHAALAMLARPTRAVSDFLTGELVDSLSPALRQFLMYTSVPAAFTPRLAEALAGPSARHQLWELERVNYPITYTRRDGELWLTYHPLLRSHFHAEIRHASVELADDLNLRTATWYDDAGLPLAALPHLLDDAAHDRLVEFLRRRALAIVLDGDGATLFAQIDSMRPDLSGDPFLWLLRAIDALTHGDALAATTYLSMLETPGAAPDSVVESAWLPPLVAAARVDAAILTGDIANLPSVPEPPPGHLDLDCYLAVQLATAMLLRGDRAGGEHHLRRALILAESSNQPRLALRSVTRLAIAAGLAGAVTVMRERANRALDLATNRTPPPGNATLMRGTETGTRLRAAAARNDAKGSTDVIHTVEASGVRAAHSGHLRTTTDAAIPDSTRDAAIPDSTGDTAIPNTTRDAAAPNSTGDTAIPNTTRDAAAPNSTGDTAIPNTTRDAAAPNSTGVVHPGREQTSETPAIAAIVPDAPLAEGPPGVASVDAASNGAASIGAGSGADIAHAAAMAAFGAYLQGDSWSGELVDATLVMSESAEGQVRPAGGWSAHVVGQLLEFHTAADRYAAADALRQGLVAMFEQGGLLPVGARRLLSHVVWALLAVREPRTALLLIEQARRVLGDGPEIALSRTALALDANHGAAVDTLLAPVLAGDLPEGAYDRVVVELLDAVRGALDDAPRRARRALENAITRAAPERLVRPFLDVPGVIGLLDEQAGSFGRHEDFVERIRHHRDARRDSAGHRLTGTETTVLEYLPSGHTAQQIAGELGVSVNTVKTHLRAIYAKFGVNSRAAALDRARRAGLL
ncbi:hypothetical protein JK358_18235 [Nocardia sp. 2]|uniref:HTH luxR-type domain-containing protein n=1 Tax=Nocardia acididurans TaxID=2802282 RepID=A0ABS1M7R1_9NOCA|nr:LuxR family transcriptional regulator [Nocardia acididurans]MBL1076341.1 hypothetical protein [Nocardia acididurans]